MAKTAEILEIPATITDARSDDRAGRYPQDARPRQTRPGRVSRARRRHRRDREEADSAPKTAIR